jgi:hypothetical protein
MNEHSVRKRQTVDSRYTAQNAPNPTQIAAIAVRYSGSPVRSASNRKQSRTTQKATGRRRIVTPRTYPAALLLMMLSMLHWGSWANTEKIDQGWRFELFYLDYTFGLLAAAVLFGLTFGRTDATSANSFFINLHAASNRSIVEAFAA